MDEELIELFHRTRDIERKFTYFLLAVDGATIAFVMTLLENKTLSWSMIPLGIALILWMISFYSGCYHNINEIMVLDSKFLFDFKISSDTESNDIEKELNEDKKYYDEKANSIVSNFWRQINTLIWGYLAFIGWYIVEMIERTGGFCW